MEKLISLFSLLVLLALPGWLHGQDLILTTNSDTINCRITKVEPYYIYFTFLKDGKAARTLIDREQVQYFSKNYFSHSELPVPIQSHGDFQKFRIDISGGYSYMTAPIHSSVDPGLRSYLKELKSGRHFGAAMSIFFSESVGLGLNYSYMNTRNGADISSYDAETGNVYYGRLVDDITIQFFAPSLNTRILFGKNDMAFNANLGIGYVAYENEAVVFDAMYIKAGTAGILFHLGLDIPVNKNIAFGISASYLSAALSSYTITEGGVSSKVELEEDNLEGISRIDLSAGLRFNF